MDFGWWIAAIALMLVVEGILPFVSPETWKNVFRRATELKDSQLRFLGLSSMLLGLLLLLLIK